MSQRALGYLLAVRFKNFVLRIVRNPKRLFGVLMLLSLFVLLIVAGSTERDASAQPSGNTIWALLSLYLLLALFGGLGEPGLAFQPADLDYVLPGPFRRAQVLLYYMGRQYAQILVLSVMYAVFLGAAGMPYPPLAWLGIFLCLAAAAHLQLLSTLSTALVGDRVFARMRTVSRAILIGVLLLGGGLALAAMATQADVSGLLWRVQDSTFARIVTHPAIQAARLARATSAAVALPALGALLAWVATTFAVALLFPVNFLETAYTKAPARKKEGLGPVVKTAEGALSLNRTPSFFRGAGAVAWLNLLTLRRRLRMVVGLIAMLVVIMLVSGQRAGDQGDTGLPKIFFVLAFFPVIANLPLGFRGQFEHLEFLKTLPVSGVRLAMAQVAVPTAVIWVVQALVVVLFWALGQLETTWALAALVAFPALDLGITTVVELFQLGKERSELGFLTTTLQMMTILFTVATSVGIGALAMLVVPYPAAGILVGLISYVAIDLVLLWLLGRRFERYEKGAA